MLGVSTSSSEAVKDQLYSAVSSVQLPKSVSQPYILKEKKYLLYLCLKICYIFTVQWDLYPISWIFSHTQRPPTHHCCPRQDPWAVFCFLFFVLIPLFDFTKGDELIQKTWNVKPDLISVKNIYGFIFLSAYYATCDKPIPEDECMIESGAMWLSFLSNIHLLASNLISLKNS